MDLEWRPELELAAVRGDIATLELARGAGCKLEDVWLCNMAALNGRLDVIKWLRAQDPPCPWEGRTCLYAASNGYLEALQWMVAAGCPWDSVACRRSARSNESVVAWIDYSLGPEDLKEPEDG